MRDWIKRFFAVDNSVNEHTVMGFLFFIATVCSGFIPGVGLPVFGGFLASTLACFKLSLNKGDVSGLQ